MKILLLPFLLSIPILLFSQGDDYCTCMEKQKEHDEIMSFVTSMNLEVSTMIPQSTTSVFVPQHAVEEESVFIIIPQKEEVKPEPKAVSQPLPVEKEQPKKYVGDTGKWKKTTAGKGQKRRRGKIKKRKKTRKYKGGCPAF